MQIINKKLLLYRLIRYSRFLINNLFESLLTPTFFLLQKISPLDRANLLGDMFSLADAGEIEYDTVMDISVYLIKENHALPWMVAKSKLMTMHTLLASSSKPYIADKFQVIY